MDIFSISLFIKHLTASDKQVLDNLIVHRTLKKGNTLLATNAFDDKAYYVFCVNIANEKKKK